MTMYDNPNRVMGNDIFNIPQQPKLRVIIQINQVSHSVAEGTDITLQASTMFNERILNTVNESAE
jgi:hypothetical protein